MPDPDAIDTEIAVAPSSRSRRYSVMPVKVSPGWDISVVNQGILAVQ